MSGEAHLTYIFCLTATNKADLLFQFFHVLINDVVVSQFHSEAVESCHCVPVMVRSHWSQGLTLLKRTALTMMKLTLPKQK